jgi:hypothetical protein
LLLFVWDGSSSGGGTAVHRKTTVFRNRTRGRIKDRHILAVSLRLTSLRGKCAYTKWRLESME